MNNKEAAEYIKRHVVEEDGTTRKAMYLAYWALQKQIPKKPLQACGHAIELFRESIPSMNYCPICGQRINWEGEEDG